ncbi:MAG: ABC transporter ATP-binding protein [Bacteroidetes bacterium GWF2_38_335]|nr:MAG: ABC transporter ATP-binding protein [Bacteroidetes bacterium GWF2_38_335]OFY78581.1 MAG: ABC transporter ATP-binding protein [Bacteroidetes bacterium RIFOXYA12_FULL_38_20]
MIEATNINKSFNDNHVLKDVTVFFEKGKINQIIGQSGMGKTVLLKSLVGLHEVDTGQINFDGRNFTAMSFMERKEIRKEIGMVFQGGALFDSLTIQENIKFPMDMFTNWSEEEKLDRVNFCLSKVNIPDTNKLFPSELSGGMQKRAAIARAISLNPRYLFCDEPNSGLDPITALIIDNLIREITIEFNITTVINTHDMNSVMEIGDKIIFIYQGYKWWEGNKNDIFTSDNKELNDFVFASELFKKVRDNHHK